MVRCAPFTIHFKSSIEKSLITQMYITFTCGGETVFETDITSVTFDNDNQFTLRLTESETATFPKSDSVQNITIAVKLYLVDGTQAMAQPIPDKLFSGI